MGNRIEPKHIGKRLLVSDNVINSNHLEIRVIEICPKRESIKVHNILADTIYWTDLSKLRIRTELPVLIEEMTDTKRIDMLGKLFGFKNVRQVLDETLEKAKDL